MSRNNQQLLSKFETTLEGGYGYSVDRDTNTGSLKIGDFRLVSEQLKDPLWREGEGDFVATFWINNNPICRSVIQGLLLDTISSPKACRQN